MNLGNDLFEKWLFTRRIKDINKSDIDLNSQVGDGLRFNNIKALAELNDVFYVKDERVLRTEFSDHILSSMNEYIKKLDDLSISKNFKSNSDELYVDFINKVKGDKANREPVLSKSRIQDPAMLLLPPNERLLIEDIKDDIIGMPGAFDIINVYGNSFCCFKNYCFTAIKGKVSVNNLDDLLDGKHSSATIDLNKYYQSASFQNLYESLGKSKHAPRKKQNQGDQDDDLNLDDDLDEHITFMKISKLMDKDVLCIVTELAHAFIIEIDDIINELINHSQTKTIKKRNWEIKPAGLNIWVFKVSESCWSIDIYNDLINKRAYIAIGHNKPGITIFAIPHQLLTMPQDMKDREIEDMGVVTQELLCAHNVPCLRFLPGSVDKDGNVLLAFVSIFGNVATLKVRINEDNTKIISKMHDFQLLDEFCWNIINLDRGDFLSVSKFEFLTLNYQKNYKESILASVYQDSVLFGYKPENAVVSNDLGIGSLTTQIPVPVANVSHRRTDFMESDICLRFSCYDDENSITKATLKHDIAISYDPLSEYYDYNVDGNLTWDDKVNYSTVDQPIGHYHPFNEFSKIDFGRSSFQTFEKWLLSNDKLSNTNSAINDNNNMELDSNRQSSFTFYKNYSDPDFIYSQDFNQLKLEPLKKKLDSKKHTQLLFLSGNSEDETSVSNNTDVVRYVAEELSKYRKNQHDNQIDSHSKKVKKLLDEVIDLEDSSASLRGYELKEYNDDFLLITTRNRIYLIKTHPLLITSYTIDDIFPIKDMSFCEYKEIFLAIHGLKYVVHLKEINAIAVASPVGPVSILRLTEFNGIYSFRQEYILGWEVQDPRTLDRANFHCILETILRSGFSNRYYCMSDDLHLPFRNILGMDYSYIPANQLDSLEPYIILYIYYESYIHRFRISVNEDANIPI